MSPPLLEVDRVGKTYGLGGLLARHRLRAVDGVSFSLSADRPEIFTIVGESGSGKTTLARMILAMVPVSDGAIRFMGRDVSTIRTQVLRLCGHPATGPSGVYDQSSARMRCPSSPPPSNRDSAAESSARAPGATAFMDVARYARAAKWPGRGPAARCRD